MKLTETQKLLKKHSNRLWKVFKNLSGVYVNPNWVLYKLEVNEYEDIPEFPENSTEKEPMISITLEDVSDANSTEFIHVLSGRKIMSSLRELDKVGKAYEDILDRTGCRPYPKFYKLLDEVKGIFKIIEEDGAL